MWEILAILAAAIALGLITSVVIIVLGVYLGKWVYNKIKDD